MNRALKLMPSVFVWIFLTIQPLFAFQDCTLRLSPEEKAINLSQEDQDALDSLPETFSLPYYRNYVKDALSFYMVRMQFAQSLLEDMLYTLRYLEREFPDELTEEIRFLVVRQFSNPQATNFLLSLGIKEAINDYFYFLQNRKEKAQGLIDHHVRGFNFVHWYGLCSSGSPYGFYQQLRQRIAFLEAKRDYPSDNPYDKLSSLPDLGIRVLKGDEDVLAERRYYRKHLEKPMLRYVVPPCEKTAGSVRIVDLVYNKAQEVWQRTSIDQELGLWSTFEDNDFRLNGKTEIIMTRDLFSHLLSKNETAFLEIQKRAGLAVEMPGDDLLACDTVAQ